MDVDDVIDGCSSKWTLGKSYEHEWGVTRDVSRSEMCSITVFSVTFCGPLALCGASFEAVSMKLMGLRFINSSPHDTNEFCGNLCQKIGQKRVASQSYLFYSLPLLFLRSVRQSVLGSILWSSGVSRGFI